MRQTARPVHVDQSDDKTVTSKRGAPGGNRTPDLDVRTVLLYPLSYEGVDPEFTVRTLPAWNRAGVTSKQTHTFRTGSVKCGTPH